MLFGERPPFRAITEKLQELESQINALGRKS